MARLRPADAFFGITFQPGPLLEQFRQDIEKFTTMRRVATAIHSEIAKDIQDRQVKQLDEQIRGHGRPQEERPGQGARLLQRTIEGRDWTSSNDQGFTIGASGTLDKYPLAAYWRHIEFGSDIFVGRILHGFFLGPGGKGRFPPMEERYPSDSRLIQVLKFHEANSSYRNPRGGRFPFDIRIHRPIPEYRFLAAGYNEYGIRITADGVQLYDAAAIESVYQSHLAALGINMRPS